LDPATGLVPAGVAASEVTGMTATVGTLAEIGPPIGGGRVRIGRAGIGAASAIAIALTAAVSASPAAAQAQTPLQQNGSDLLQPALEGNPSSPPRFRRIADTTTPVQGPPTSSFSATSRVGATPVYGSPTAFGAGDTGFDSTNARKRRKAAPTPSTGSAAAPPPETTFAPIQNYKLPPPPAPPAPKKPQPPEIYPKKAAQRPGAALPPLYEPLPVSNPPAVVYPAAAAGRPGAILPAPPQLDFGGATTAPPLTPQPNTLAPGTLPLRQLPIGTNDPYAALGIRAGAFNLLPSLDLVSAYNTNPQRQTGAPGAVYFVAAPELQVASDWERHALTADILGSYTEYLGSMVPSLNVPYFSSKVNGRIDVTRDTQILLENRYLVTTDNPGSPNLQAQLAKLPIDTDLGGTLGVVQQFNRLSVSLRGTVDDATYYNSTLTDGGSASNADRNFNQYAGIGRIAYEFDPSLKPFIEFEGDQRIHGQQFDRNGLQRDSTGLEGRMGSALDLFGSLTGEIAVGYVNRTYKDPTLPPVSGVIADGALLWQATALTSAKLTLSSQVYETIYDGASGELSRDVGIEVDHAFRRWLIGIFKAGYGNDNYVGSALRDNRYFVSGGVNYKLSRDVAIRTEIREDWLFATQSSLTYMATSVLVGLHLQR
jgi:hypothetical protein